MNTPNHPDELWLGKKGYALWTDVKVNGWLYLAALSSGIFDVVLSSQVHTWSLVTQATVAVLPFLAIALWVPNLMRWIRGMDELHRTLLIRTVLFATSITFFIVLAWSRLNHAGIFEALSPTAGRPGASWDIGTVCHVFLLMTLFYYIGDRLFIRHYQ